MDSFELNKIIGAVLGTLLFIMGVGFLAEAIYHPIEGRGPGYALPEPEGTEVAEGPAEPQIVPIAVRLQTASAERGAAAARKCQSCHNFGEGEGNKSGPVLWGTVGNQIAGHEGYSYSGALTEFGATGETWTYENLDHWLAGPQAFAPGTKMTLSVGNPDERADILAYLQSLSNDPVPFPEPEASDAEGDAVPAGDEVAEPEAAQDVEVNAPEGEAATPAAEDAGEAAAEEPPAAEEPAETAPAAH